MVRFFIQKVFFFFFFQENAEVDLAACEIHENATTADGKCGLFFNQWPISILKSQYWPTHHEIHLA